ncbi:MAG: hypothetical protein ACP5IL_06105 [Syntrophobacteraceae bacterium]
MKETRYEMCPNVPERSRPQLALEGQFEMALFTVQFSRLCMRQIGLSYKHCPSVSCAVAFFTEMFEKTTKIIITMSEEKN